MDNDVNTFIEDIQLVSKNIYSLYLQLIRYFWVA